MREGEFRSMRDILARSRSMRLIREQSRLEGVRAAWTAAVGDAVASRTRVLRLRDGKLIVEVSSPPLLLELSSFRKAELLERVRREDALRGVVDFVFRSA